MRHHSTIHHGQSHLSEMHIGRVPLHHYTVSDDLPQHTAPHYTTSVHYAAHIHYTAYIRLTVHIHHTTPYDSYGVKCTQCVSPLQGYMCRCHNNTGLFHWANHTLNKGNFVLVQIVFLVQHPVCPWVREVLEGNIQICVMRHVFILTNTNHKAEELSLHVV